MLKKNQLELYSEPSLVLELVLELGSRTNPWPGPSRLSPRINKIEKRERYLQLYSEISFGLGRLGQSGPWAGPAGPVSAFRVLSGPAGPDPGPKPFPFLFFLTARPAELCLVARAGPEFGPKPFSVPVFIFIFEPKHNVVLKKLRFFIF